MEFDQYVDLIVGSVVDSGYDNFFPSLCRPGELIKMDVLAIDLTDDGEEHLAKEWAAKFAEPDRKLFLAYRQGERTVTVVEIVGFEVTDKRNFEVKPFSATEQ